MKTFAVFALALALLPGCATVPLAPEMPDRLVTSAPAPERASIIVVRPGWLGTAVLLPVTLDGLSVGSLAPKTYFHLEVPPGPHVLAVTDGSHVERVHVPAVAGQQYFYRVTVMPGALVPEGAASGQRAVARSRLAQRLDQ